MSDLSVDIKNNNITLEMRQHDITVEINRLGGSGVREVPGTVDFVDGVATSINTLQSGIIPRIITVFDSSGKRIDKNLPEPTVNLSTTYYINYPKTRGLSFLNCKVYYV